MSTCKRCGRKIGYFELQYDGLCSECNFKLNGEPAQRKQQEEKERIKQETIEAENERQRKLEEDFQNGILPPLHCSGKRTMSLHGKYLVIEGKHQSTNIPVNNIIMFTYTPPRGISDGIFKFNVGSGNSGYIGVGAVQVGVGNEITVVFDKDDVEIAQLYNRYLLEKT